jgi:glutaredoxin
MQAKRMCALFLVLCAGVSSAQVYRWKDSQGITHFSDTPPAASVPTTKIDGTEVANFAPALPFALARAIKDHPVTLYTTSQCAACDQGRALLQARGIPYQEKTVSTAADHAALRQAGGASQLPLLLVGRSKFIGYEQATWDAALTTASYPPQSILPPDYKQVTPRPAAPLPIDGRTGTVGDGEDGKPRPLPAPRATPNFQF